MPINDTATDEHLNGSDLEPCDSNISDSASKDKDELPADLDIEYQQTLKSSRH